MGRKRKTDLGELLRGVRQDCKSYIDDCLTRLICGTTHAIDQVKERVKPSISEGLGIAYSETGLTLLMKEFRTETEVGKQLSVTQPAVSQMLTRRKLNSNHMAYANYRYTTFDRVAQEGAVLATWFCVTDYLRRTIVAPGNMGRPPVFSMDYEQCACLAIAALHPARKVTSDAGVEFDWDKFGDDIIDKTHHISWINDIYGTLGKAWRVRAAPDLVQLEREWRDSFFLAAWFLPMKEIE
jgi:hypothetical protein